MKLYRMISILAVAMLAMTAFAQQATMTFSDALRHQTITVTAVGEDIVRVDVVPDGWSGTRLPSLALEKNAKVEAKVEDLEDMSVMRTAGGLKVVLDKNTGSVTVGCRNIFYIADLCDRSSSTLTLLHQGQESFYGAGERLLVQPGWRHAHQLQCPELRLPDGREAHQADGYHHADGDFFQGLWHLL